MQNGSGKLQEKRLERFGLRIVTAFWCGRSMKQRASDGSVSEEITDGVIMDKKYYRGGKLIHTEAVFNPLMQYSYVSGEKPDEEIECANCGWRGKASEFSEGCPYCGASCHIAYGEGTLAAKRFAEKKAKDPKYFLSMLVLSLGICVGLGILLVRLTGRTFGTLDILKGAAFGTAAGMAVFYGLYLKNANTITKKAEENYRRQSKMLTKFENGMSKLGIPLDIFFTNLNTETAARFFEDSFPEYQDIADWDVLDYDECLISENGQEAADVSVRMNLRVLRMKGNRLRSAETPAHAILKLNHISRDPTQAGKSFVHCHACGSAIDIQKTVCSFCGAPVHYRQMLYLTDLKLK